MRWVLSSASALVLLSVALSCSSDQQSTPQACVPGAVSVCPCTSGAQGVQTCDADGTAYGACAGCGDGGTGGTGGAGSGGTGTGGSAASGGFPGCNEGDCSGCADCVATCVCEGRSESDCVATCFGSGGTAGAGATGGSGGGGGGSGGSAGAAVAGRTRCGLTNPDLCEVGVEKCCIIEPGVDYCTPSTEACQCEGFSCGIIEGFCDGTEDCPSGEVCCGTWDGQGYSQFECRSSCATANNEFEICHEGITQCAELGTTCSTSQLFPSWYQRCRN